MSTHNLDLHAEIKQIISKIFLLYGAVLLLDRSGKIVCKLYSNKPIKIPRQARFKRQITRDKI